MTDKVENYTYKDKRWYSLEDFEGEEWRLIEGYGDVYFVSNYGRVKTAEKERVSGRGGLMKYRERILRHGVRRGYLGVTLCFKGKTTCFTVHRLVAKAFIPNPDNKPETDHINTRRYDNRVCNLRWVTRVENANNPISLKNKKDNCVPPMKGKFGKDNPESIPIIAIAINGSERLLFDSISDAYRSGYNLGHVAECIRGDRKSHRGYRWYKQSEYKESYGN